jgi:hypothetical protein
VDVVLAHSIDDLPHGGAALFPPDPFASVVWFRIVTAHALEAGTKPYFAVLLQDGRPCAVVPLQLHGGRLRSLTTPYTTVYWPSLSGSSFEPAFLQAVGRRLGQFCRSWPTVRFDAIPAEWPGLAPFSAGLRQAGLYVQKFEHFGNWYEPTDGLSWPAYLAGRPGVLRETIRRKLKLCAREAVFESFADPAGLERGINAFETVYRGSWKAPEPFPSFNAALMQEASALGTLRLGVLWVGGRPAAAQFWLLAGGQATVVKLAHDEVFKSLSPGTVLTAMMVRELLGGNQVTFLDFGRGDDAYKALWTSRRRQRVGLLLMNPWRPAGIAALGRHMVGDLRNKMNMTNHCDGVILQGTPNKGSEFNQACYAGDLHQCDTIVAAD